MNLYTIIFEYRGGTYIEQKYAKNEKEALLLWSKEIDVESIKFMGQKIKEKMQQEIEKDIKECPPKELTKCKNAWCAGIYASGLINIIKTNSL